ncbi:MAG TPA: hypothetical protein VFE42_23440 [Chloroflexota bacterium]|nr:hypothetical protein [Chloroflexota bacterium]
MPKAQRTASREKKALQRVERARNAYTRAENRLGALRLRLDLAERKLARRAERLALAEATLTALATGQASTVSDAIPEGSPVTAPASVNGAREKAPARPSRRKAQPERPV